MTNEQQIKSHSMGTELVEPMWASLTLDAVNTLLKYYDQFNQASEIVWHSPRPFSSAAIIVIDGERYFVKRHAVAIRDEEGLYEEHRIMQHLREQGIPVSQVVEGQKGQTAFTLDEWTYEIHLLGKGVDLYQDAISWSPFSSTNHAFAAGEMMAKMHQAAQSFSVGKRKVQPLVSAFEIWMSDTPIEAVKAFTSERTGLAQYLGNRKWEEEFEQILFPFFEQFKNYKHTLKPLWTHNDWHASNLLWTDESKLANVATVLDFGLSNETSAIYDVATALERNVVEWLDIQDASKSVIHLDATIAFLRGYQSIQAFTTEEKYALVTIFPLVHTDFALSEIDYFVRITKKLEDADMAYEEFLIGHAQWFTSEQGQVLLQAIRTELAI